jgi:hypothetical protein
MEETIIVSKTEYIKLKKLYDLVVELITESPYLQDLLNDLTEYINNKQNREC